MTKSVLPRSLGKLPGLLSLLIVVVTAGCNKLQPSDTERAFTQQFPYEDVNHSLVLHPIEEITDTSLTQVVTILLENRSDLIIAIWPESNVVGLVYDTETEKWVEIKNIVEFPDKGLLVGPRGGEIPSSTAIYFQPDVVSTASSMDVRILVVGNVWDEELEAREPMAAYLDLRLEK